MHMGLQDWTSEIDTCKLTLEEGTLLGAYTTVNMRTTVPALHAGVFGDLTWVEQRPRSSCGPDSPQQGFMRLQGYQVSVCVEWAGPHDAMFRLAADIFPHFKRGNTNIVSKSYR